MGHRISPLCKTVKLNLVNIQRILQQPDKCQYTPIPFQLLQNSCILYFINIESSGKTCQSVCLNNLVVFVFYSAKSCLRKARASRLEISFHYSFKRSNFIFLGTRYI